MSSHKLIVGRVDITSLATTYNANKFNDLEKREQYSYPLSSRTLLEDNNVRDNTNIQEDNK